MAKDKISVTVKLDADVDEWLEQEADQLGLDKPTLVRMWIYQRRNGIGIPRMVERVHAQHGIEPHEIAPAPVVPEVTGHDGPTPLPDINIDLDAMVSATVANAEAEGLTDPIEDLSPMESGGTRPLRRRPPPFSLATASAWEGR